MTDQDPAPPDWQLLELLAATPVSRTWRVAVGGQLAVLRQDEPGARRIGLNRGAEPGILRAAAAAGLGPACLFADPARGLLLTDWLPGRAWSAEELREPANLKRAAELLRRLHATPLVGGTRVDLGAAIDRYSAVAGKAFAGAAAAAREQLAAVGAPSGATGKSPSSLRRSSKDLPVAPEGAPTGEALCFCHGDPTPGNFIASAAGELRLIDWEYGGLGHPGFDLAGLALGADLTAEGVVLLLTTYRGRPPTPAEFTRHRAWERLCRSLGGLWAAALREFDQALRENS